MDTRREEAKAALLDRAAAHARARLAGPQAAMAEVFVRRYWERVAAEDLTARDPIDLYGAALSHLQLAERRVPGTPLVRVYSPTFDDHGWASPRSVVEITTDDMPFLVDLATLSVAMREARALPGRRPGGNIG